MAQHLLGGSWEKPRRTKIVEEGCKRIPNSLQLPATVLQHRIALDMHEFDTSNSKEGFWQNVGYFLAVTGSCDIEIVLLIRKPWPCYWLMNFSGWIWHVDAASCTKRRRPLDRRTGCMQLSCSETFPSITGSGYLQFACGKSLMSALEGSKLCEVALAAVSIFDCVYFNNEPPRLLQKSCFDPALAHPIC